ncbi:murein biosynthesis integral membrane protein MurJ [Pelagibacteraceae bacterium]|nr:murein biosynthesis integral membrane protein MurJ [Pelagibacteraceae bacterium]
MNLLSSASIFSFYTLVSRLLGYIRDILIAVFLGASIYADAFFVAFRLPNTFRRLFAEGVFNAAFIPSYAEAKLTNKSEGKKFADDVLNLLIIILLGLVFLVEIFTPAIVYLIAPGFAEDTIKFDLAVTLTRITFPFLFFVSLSSFFSGILNTNNKFAAAAAAPIILNIFLIISLIFSNYLNLNFELNLSYAVSLSGLFQLLFLIFFTKRYYKPSINFKIKINSKVNFFLKKLMPSIFSSGVTQINILVGTIIASFEAGAVSYLYYADRIYQINLAIAGIAIGTVALPELSKSIKIGNLKNAMNIQNKSLELCLLLSLPACFGLVIASEEIVSALFGYGSFSEENVILTGNALKYFGYGVPAFALIKVLSNFLFARDNTKFPFYISAFIVFVNILISIVYFRQIGFVIIPIATSLSTWIGVLIYSILLIKLKYFNFESNFFVNFIKIVISLVIMTLALCYSINFFEDKLIYSNYYKSFYLIMIVALAAGIYLLLTRLLGVFKIKNFITN